MRVAAIYDIHGNLPALEAVVAEIRAQGVDRIVVGGDVVPGPLPRETIDLLRTIHIPIDFIRGNGDRAVLDAMKGNEVTSVPEAFRHLIQWTASQLDESDREMFESWPSTLELDLDGTRAFFCHATPQSDLPIFTRLTAEAKLAPLFDDLGADLVVCGHTHMQFDRKVGEVRLVNAGSVGMPFGERGAYWLMLTPDVDLRRNSYDFDGAAERIRAGSYPDRETFAAKNILNPPTEDFILEAYSKAELK